jgi:hypothetical protein
MVVKILRAAVVDIYPHVIKRSQSQPEPIEHNHIIVYGSAFKYPFCGKKCIFVSDFHVEIRM